ncbi:MAG: UbiD family decarboxylase [Alphaproteobacteria bacterium]|nr:UbiD family decarboxylase [Alphaproteobacteria bacterium]
MSAGSKTKRGYRDLQEHLAALQDAGLLVTIDEPIDKDRHLQPLVRWQFRGGMPESERKAFLFTNVTDAKGRRYDIPVLVGALAANPDIYCIGMGVDRDEIGALWQRAIANPIAPCVVTEAPCHEVVIDGAALQGEGNGMDALPIPISSPGFDVAPYLTMTACITRDPETGTQNMGTYRAGLKAPDRLAVRMVVRPGGAEGYLHWQKYQARGEKMPIAIVLGCPPAAIYTAPQKLPIGLEELHVAGGLAGEAINVVKAKSVDLMVPAESELVIEGLIDTEYLEPEAPFGESSGYVALEDYNMRMQITAITRKAKPVLPSIISQVTPSESSVIKRVAYEPLFLSHLRDELGIKGVVRVAMHEPLTNIRKVIFVQFERGVPRTEIWRALYATASLQAACGKFVIAINEDIDPDNGDAVFWALGYRANPALDARILDYQSKGQGPKIERGVEDDSALLIDATLKDDMPPLALPRPQFMEEAREIWNELGLPPLKPESPWHGYELGRWSDRWEAIANRAVAGDYLENGRISDQQKRKGVKPETPVPDDLS